MATGRPRRILRTNPPSILAFSGIRLLLFSLVFALCTGFAKANCGADFLFPAPGLVFYYLDTINVTYTSNFSSPSLFCFCGQAQVEQKYEIKAPAFNSSMLVLLNFKSSDPCWFDLRPMTGACGDNSPQFTINPGDRHQSESQTTIGLLSYTTTAAASSKTGLPSEVPDHHHGPTNGELSTGAKAGIAIAAIGASLAILGMAACFYFRRRKRLQDSGVLGGRGRKGLEKMGRGLSDTSDVSNQSSQPLQGVQPVYDGFPGSTGYDDGRSLGSSAYLYSPHSPTMSSNGGYYASERDELEAARTRHELEEARKREEIRLHNAPAASSIVSYGPNPITPVISPRPSTRFETPVTPSPPTEQRYEGYEEYYAPVVTKTPSVQVQQTAAVQRTATVQSYSHTPAEYYAPGARNIPPVPEIRPMEYYAPQAQSLPPHPQHPSPQKPAPPIIVSYGPNRITPTPAITPTTTIPPTDLHINNQQRSAPEFPVMGFPSHPFPSHEAPIHDFDNIALPEESPPSAIAPLPPYASAADFYAMEKGAIRKLDEPKATAELPPTKDGYYQYGDRADEYELQGTGPRGEQQQRHQPYRNQADTTRGRGGRDVDEQKFLLSDVEISRMREMKAKKRAEESYEMQPPGSSRQQS